MARPIDVVTKRRLVDCVVVHHGDAYLPGLKIRSPFWIETTFALPESLSIRKPTGTVTGLQNGRGTSCWVM
jgi:hypothetical protein